MADKFAQRIGFHKDKSPLTAVSSHDPLPVRVYNQSSFGEVLTAENTQEIQLQFAYNINAAQIIAFPGNGGSITHADDSAVLSSGTETNGFALLLTRDVLKYNSGQGAMACFSAIFTDGVADTEQVMGVGSNLDGYLFGYDGEDFGVLLRARGSAEIRKMVITTASTTAEDISITLDGDTATDVTVSNSGDVSITAREIAAHNFASLGVGWGATSSGGTVTFISVDAAAHTGSYAISATTTQGTFSQVAVGTATTDTWTKQADWNQDKMDGVGDSVMLLDTAKGNVYRIAYQWGYGAIVFSIEDPETGLFRDVHMVKYANQNVLPSSSNPTFGIFANALSKGGTTSVTIKTSSLAGFIQGRVIHIGPNFSENRLFNLGSTTDETPVLTIRNKLVYHDRVNRTRITPTLLTIACSLGTGNCVFRIYRNATPEGGTNYIDIDADASVVESDLEGTEFDTSVATLVATVLLSANESQIMDIESLNLKVPPGTTVLITAQSSKSNANNDVGATINWKELF